MPFHCAEQGTRRCVANARRCDCDIAVRRRCRWVVQWLLRCVLAREGDCSTHVGFAATVPVWGLASSGIGLSRRLALRGGCAVRAARGHEGVNDARVQRIKGAKKIAGRRPRARGTISSQPAGLHRDSACFVLPGYCLAKGFRRSGVCCDLLVLVTGLPSDVGGCWRRGSGPNGPRMRQP